MVTLRVLGCTFSNTPSFIQSVPLRDWALYFYICTFSCIVQPINELGDASWYTVMVIYGHYTCDITPVLFSVIYIYFGMAF